MTSPSYMPEFSFRLFLAVSRWPITPRLLIPRSMARREPTRRGPERIAPSNATVSSAWPEESSAFHGQATGGCKQAPSAALDVNSLSIARYNSDSSLPRQLARLLQQMLGEREPTVGKRNAIIAGRAAKRDPTGLCG